MSFHGHLQILESIEVLIPYQVVHSLQFTHLKQGEKVTMTVSDYHNVNVVLASDNDEQNCFKWLLDTIPKSISVNKEYITPTTKKSVYGEL